MNLNRYFANEDDYYEAMAELQEKEQVQGDWTWEDILDLYPEEDEYGDLVPFIEERYKWKSY